MDFADHSMFVVVGHLFPSKNLWSYQVLTKIVTVFLSQHIIGKLGNISCCNSQAAPPHLREVYSPSRIIIK